MQTSVPDTQAETLVGLAMLVNGGPPESLHIIIRLL